MSPSLLYESSEQELATDLHHNQLQANRHHRDVCHNAVCGFAILQSLMSGMLRTGCTICNCGDKATCLHWSFEHELVVEALRPHILAQHASIR